MFGLPGGFSSGTNVQGGNPFAFGSRAEGLTKRTVRGTPGGMGTYEDVYGGLSAADEKDIALAPTNFRREVFNKTFPFIGGLLGGGAGNAGFSAVGGMNTALPQLPNSFVYSPDQIQQQVNAARAQGDQGAFTQKQGIGQDMASRGFGQRNPLAMAMTQAADSGARMSNADQERQIRFGAAGENAKQGLAVGGLANQQWGMFNNADIERRKMQIDSILNSQRNVAALLSSLGSFG